MHKLALNTEISYNKQYKSMKDDMNDIGSPLFDVIIVERKQPERTFGSFGIVLPDVALAEQDIGTIVAAGPGEMSDNGTILPMFVKVGDKVLYSKYANLEFECPMPDGTVKKLTSMHQKDVIMVLKN